MKVFKISTISIVNKNLSSVIKLGKDSTNTIDRTNVVYRICCKVCEACNIGETKRSLKTRIKEYINNKNNESVVSQHQIDFGHEFLWNRTVVVESEISYKKRSIFEMIRIKCHKNSINKKDDIYTLNSNYFPLLKGLKV